MSNHEARGRDRASFLLAQIGSHAAAAFAERLAPLGFAPYHAGIFRMLARTPGLSQQDLAGALNMHASRLVGILDELQQKGLLERRPSESDRRLYALYLTAGGNRALEKIGAVAREHHQAMMAGLSPGQEKQLTEILETIVRNQGLRSGVHPGYRQLRSSKSRAQAPEEGRRPPQE